jgi:hypothetical protein
LRHGRLVVVLIGNVQVVQPGPPLEHLFDQHVVVATGLHPKLVMLRLVGGFLQGGFAHNDGVKQPIQPGLNYSNKVLAVDEFSV